MSKMQRILVPVDFSDVSRAATHYAIGLSEQFNPTIDILHIWDLPAFLSPYPIQGGAGSTPASIADYARQRVDEAMTSFMADLDGDINRAMDAQHTLHLIKHVKTGEPAAVILDMAQEMKHDLIVMGTHGRSGLAHLFIGSVTERVMREAPCPVLAVPPKTE